MARRHFPWATTGRATENPRPDTPAVHARPVRGTYPDPTVAPMPDHDDLTVVERILLAAHALAGAQPFQVEALAVRAWRLWPHRFSLATPQTPHRYVHSVTVFSKMGRLRAEGHANFLAESVYQLTPPGVERAEELRRWLTLGTVGLKPPAVRRRAA